MDWFLFDHGLSHERVKTFSKQIKLLKVIKGNILNSNKRKINRKL